MRTKGLRQKAAELHWCYLETNLTIQLSMSDVQGFITVDSVCMGSIMTETDQVPNLVGNTPDVTKDRVRQEATRQPES